MEAHREIGNMNGAHYQALAANGRLVRGADGRLRDAGLQKIAEPGGTQSDHCTTDQPTFIVACAQRMFVRYITEVVDQKQYASSSLGKK